MIKIFFFIVLIVFLCAISIAQQLPQYTQYMYNKMAINPGAAGAEKYSEIAISHRSQWTGFEGSPSTQILSGHHRIAEKKFALGGYIFNDMTGPVRNTGFNFTYSYHLRVSSNSELSMGLSGSVFQSAIDGTKIRLYHLDDKLIDQSVQYNTVVPDVSFGLWYYTEKYFAGLSILHLAKTNVNIEIFKNADYRAGLPLEKHFYLTGGYNFEIKEKYQLQPSLFVNYMSNNPIQITATLLSSYQRFIHFGIAWRSGDALSLIAGASVIECLQLSFSYDIGISAFITYQNGSHEIVLSYRFKNTSDKQPGALFNVKKTKTE